jgi:NADH-ubiquinone oxidoreductase chain 1
MTEHSAVIFVFFFLAEYASIILMCILLSIVFLGGYNTIDIFYIIYNLIFYSFFLVQFIIILLEYVFNILINNHNDLWYLMDNNMYIIPEKELFYTWYSFSNNPMFKGLFYSFILAIKSCILIFAFIWVRASYPRIRFDVLMMYCWTVLLPILIGFIIFIPCILYSFDIIPSSISLL